MSRSYRLSWRRAPVGLVDGAVLRPDRLCALAPAQVREVLVVHGAVESRLGDVFEVAETTAVEESTLTVEGSTLFVRLGAAMEGGSLHVDGPCGRAVGASMQGGEIRVHGDAGPLAGAGMRGGRLLIHGDAGPLLGGPLPGATRGMAGGEILVRGDAGERVGLRLRRGTIAVGGGVGRGAGHHLLAGTIVVGRGPLLDAGVGMRRGSLVSLSGEVDPLPSFRPSGLVRPVYLALLLSRLAELGLDVPPSLARGRWRSFSGDLLALGRGEILAACHRAPL